jgi:hypothetical protein
MADTIYHFEKFDVRTRLSAKTPMATIGKSKFILFNRACRREFLEGLDWAELYYDAGERLIGIKPLQTGTNDAWRLRRIGRKHPMIRVSAAALFKRHGLAPDRTMSFPVRRDQGLLIIDLKGGR